MLSILRSLVQEVNSARDLQEALEIIVSRVQKAMGTEVCSVYLLDPASNRYILMATEGLYKDSVGQVSLAYSEGLVGLVGSREEPINLEDAPSHPRYRYFPETGEERFRSFLGVPIIHHRRVMGVLVVQQRESSRCFDEGEEAFLVTVSAQLAGVIAHSEATGAISGLSLTGEEARDVSFSGVPARRVSPLERAWWFILPPIWTWFRKSRPKTLARSSSSFVQLFRRCGKISSALPTALLPSSGRKSRRCSMFTCGCWEMRRYRVRWRIESGKAFGLRAP